MNERLKKLKEEKLLEQSRCKHNFFVSMYPYGNTGFESLKYRFRAFSCQKCGKIRDNRGRKPAIIQVSA